MLKPIVKLIAHTENPEQIVASAAKLCYSSSSISDVMAMQTPENVAKFVKMLANMGHESPLEHISFTFGIENVSRSLLAQITRHRIASYSVQSQRYVKTECFEFVTPPEIENIPEAKFEYQKAMQEASEHYISLLNMLEQKHKNELINEGKTPADAEKLAEKMSLEDARFVLPNSCCTKIVCTMNARSLLHFFSLRCCNRAQWEIRQVACMMLKLVKEIAPNIFANAGPECVRSNCSQAKMSCGKINQVRDYFKSMTTERTD